MKRPITVDPTLVRRLKAAGCPLPAENDVECPLRIRVTQQPPTLGSFARALPQGTLFVLDLSVVALASKVIIQDLHLSSPEWEFGAWLLSDPALHRSSDRYYRLPDGSDYLRDEVLNQRVDEQITLRRGDMIRGVILAQAFEPLPRQYTHGALMPICLAIADQFEDSHESTFELYVDRAAEKGLRRASRRSNLFGAPPGSIVPPGWSADVPSTSSNSGGSAAERKGRNPNKGS